MAAERGATPAGGPPGPAAGHPCRAKVEDHCRFPCRPPPPPLPPGHRGQRGPTRRFLTEAALPQWIRVSSVMMQPLLLCKAKNHTLRHCDIICHGAPERHRNAITWRNVVH